MSEFVDKGNHREIAPTGNPEAEAHCWLAQYQVKQPRLTKLFGFTNHVFLVEQDGLPQRSVLRMANRQLDKYLCPLAHVGEQVVRQHQDAAGLGLAPQLLEADADLGVMWMVYAGERRSLQMTDFPEIRRLFQRLHHSGLVWDNPVGASGSDDYCRQILLTAQDRLPSHLAGVLNGLLVAEQRLGIKQLPRVPVHSDLNPGNWLHDGQRWWIVDWDYAGMQSGLWDYAGLIVEHGWDGEFARELARDLDFQQLSWFCAVLALFSWQWHVGRGSDDRLVGEKTGVFEEWVRVFAEYQNK